jgi:uncharacterized protein (DUF433 family)
MATLEIRMAEPPPLRVDEHGVVRIGRTRVPLDTVIGEYLDGATVEEIVCGYDTLDPADVHAVISYYLRHREEVEAYLKQRQQKADEMRHENEKRFPSQEWRERLLARRRRENAAG